MEPLVSLFHLISYFIEWPILNKDGDNQSRGFGIPPIGLFSHVLLDVYLDVFDQEMKLIPGIHYHRSIEECFVLFPLMTFPVVDISIDDIKSYMLELVGKIRVLEPGDAPIQCFGGNI